MRKKYNFRWNPSTFSLLDESDSVNFGYLKVAPPPFDMTNLLCELVHNGSAAIIYFSNSGEFGRSTAASQYFIKMAGFLGVPVIAWNADNIGLEKVGFLYLLLLVGSVFKQHEEHQMVFWP